MSIIVKNIINDNNNITPNQFSIRIDSNKYFQSYKSVVARISNQKVTLSKHWDYSNTTRKHLYIFLRDNGYRISRKSDVVKRIENGEFELVNVNSLELV